MKRILYFNLIFLAIVSWPEAAKAMAVPCVQGNAAGFSCDGVDLLARVPLATLGGTETSEVQGWTDPQTGREYALITIDTGVAAVEVSDPENPIIVARFETGVTSDLSYDLRVYSGHAFVVGFRMEGMQVFDLTQLRTVQNAPATFSSVATYDGFERATSLTVNPESGFAYIMESLDVCHFGLHMIDIRNPRQPTYAGCHETETRGTTSGSFCVNYRGPDATYRGREICFTENFSGTLDIADVTDKSATRILSKNSYGVDPTSTRLGGLTRNQRYFLYVNSLRSDIPGSETRTYIFDVSDLDQASVIGSFQHRPPSINTQQKIRGNFHYQVHLRAGLQVYSLSEVQNGTVRQVASFDTHPEANGLGSGGAVSVFPFPQSCTVAVADAQRGLFLLRPTVACQCDNGSPDRCQNCGPCGAGEGDCDGDQECAAGLSCVDDVGAQFGFGPNIDVCVDTGGGGGNGGGGGSGGGGGNGGGGGSGGGGCALPLGHPNYCRDCGPCGNGQGDCDRDSDCTAGLVCADDVGAQFGFGPRIDVCVQAPGSGGGGGGGTGGGGGGGGGACSLPLGHPNYCRDCGPCGAGQGDCDRDSDCTAGLTCADNVGADFGFGPNIDVCVASSSCPLPPGHGNYCNVCGPCASGQGDCDRDSDCVSGLTCVQDIGAEFGFGPGIDVCR